MVDGEPPPPLNGGTQFADKFPPVDRALLHEYQKRSSNVAPSCKEVLEAIYGPQIEDFEYPIPGAEDLDYKPIFGGLLLSAFESGILKEQKYTDPNGKEHVSPGSVAFRRGSFVTQIAEKANIQCDENGMWNTDTDISLAFYDIAGFRQADLAKDSQDRSSADVILNDVVSLMNSEIITSNLQGKVHVCRYGGDEFVVGGAGVTPEKLAQLDDAIRKKIKTLKGWYREVGGKSSTDDRENKIQFNKSKDSLFLVSKEHMEGDEGIKKSIFLSFFKKGLFLDSDQINKIVKRYRKEDISKKPLGDTTLLDELKPHSIYPQSIFSEGDTESNKFEIITKYICDNNPQLKVLIDLARVIDEEESRNTGTPTIKRTEAIIHFIENTIYDPVLEYNIYSFTDFVESLKADKFKMIRTIDCKFIKEVNDEYSVVEGDEVIKAVWKKINGVMEAVTGAQGKLRIGRRGGTFFIGMDSQTPIREVDLQELNKAIAQNLQDVEVTLREEGITIPLGLSELVKANRQEEKEKEDAGGISNKEEDEKYMNRVIGEAISQSEKDWYRKALIKFQTLNTEKGLKSLLLSLEDDGSISPSFFDTIQNGSEKKVWTTFFTGKRSKERTAALMRTIKEEPPK